MYGILGADILSMKILLWKRVHNFYVIRVGAEDMLELRRLGGRSLVA